MIRRLRIWIILLTLIGVWVFSDRLFPSETITAAVAQVKDGDTLVVGTTTFRLAGIDAPEYHQLCKDAQAKPWPCGKAARSQLDAYVQSGSITCVPRAEDKYGRKVAKCASATVPDLAEAMVQSGLAISPAERGTAAYADAEDAAKTAKRGLWQGSFDAPSDYRLLHPRGVTPKPRADTP
jgi:endonuclease YncB( thermonuclease family)